MKAEEKSPETVGDKHLAKRGEALKMKIMMPERKKVFSVSREKQIKEKSKEMKNKTVNAADERFC